jgi:hypothetical protein
MMEGMVEEEKFYPNAVSGFVQCPLSEGGLPQRETRAMATPNPKHLQRLMEGVEAWNA